MAFIGPVIIPSISMMRQREEMIGKFQETAERGCFFEESAPQGLKCLRENSSQELTGCCRRPVAKAAEPFLRHFSRLKAAAPSEKTESFFRKQVLTQTKKPNAHSALFAARLNSLLKKCEVWAEPTETSLRG